MINMRDIQARLKKMYDKSGKTQIEISRESGVSQSYINDLLSGKSSTENMSIKKLNQLFPEVTLAFDGGASAAPADEMTALLLEKWRTLDMTSRCKVIAFAADLAKTGPPPSPDVPTTKILCPSCSEIVPIPEGAETVYCGNCGQKIKFKGIAHA